MRNLRSITCVGWDGRSKPILRYSDELHLSDHLRSSVTVQDRLRHLRRFDGR